MNELIYWRDMARKESLVVIEGNTARRYDRATGSYDQTVTIEPSAQAASKPKPAPAPSPDEYGYKYRVEDDEKTYRTSEQSYRASEQSYRTSEQTYRTSEQSYRTSERPHRYETSYTYDATDVSETTYTQAEPKQSVRELVVEDEPQQVGNTRLRRKAIPQNEIPAWALDPEEPEETVKPRVAAAISSGKTCSSLGDILASEAEEERRPKAAKKQSRRERKEAEKAEQEKKAQQPKAAAAQGQPAAAQGQQPRPAVNTQNIQNQNTQGRFVQNPQAQYAQQSRYGMPQGQQQTRRQPGPGAQPNRGGRENGRMATITSIGTIFSEVGQAVGPNRKNMQNRELAFLLAVKLPLGVPALLIVLAAAAAALALVYAAAIGLTLGSIALSTGGMVSVIVGISRAGHGLPIMLMYIGIGLLSMGMSLLVFFGVRKLWTGAIPKIARIFPKICAKVQ